jgi:energy-coupling factor transport system substrate-specific component
MYFDDAGEIWVLSSNGVYVVNGDALLADQEQDYAFYDMECGLPCVTTANSRSYLDEDGTLYISGATGVNQVNINEAMHIGGSVKLAVPFIEADDEMITLTDGEKVTIPSNCKRLTIYGYALTFALDNPRVSYYLEGFNEEMESVSRQELQPVSYTNLKGGTYVFHLSVMDSITGEVENSIEVTIVKQKALHEMLWFWFVLGLLLVALIFLCVRSYTKWKTAELMRKQEESKTFISQIIHAFAKSIDLKDQYTNGHSFRVAKYAAMLAEKMGYSETEVDNVYNIGLLHDIGKITIPVGILNKPGRLTDEEYKIVKQHASNGYDILKEIEIAPQLALGAGYHHERIDGKGYPSGKAGDEIPMVAQIIAVADTFDAMNSTRPYRKQMKMEDIQAELKRVSGTQLNPDIVKLLLELIDEGAFREETPDGKQTEER